MKVKRPTKSLGAAGPAVVERRTLGACCYLALGYLGHRLLRESLLYLKLSEANKATGVGVFIRGVEYSGAVRCGAEKRGDLRTKEETREKTNPIIFRDAIHN